MPLSPCTLSPHPTRASFPLPPRPFCAQKLKNKTTANRLQREQLLANYLIRLMLAFHLQVNTFSFQMGHSQHALVNENQ